MSKQIKNKLDDIITKFMGSSEYYPQDVWLHKHWKSLIELRELLDKLDKPQIKVRQLEWQQLGNKNLKALMFPDLKFSDIAIYYIYNYGNGFGVGLGIPNILHAYESLESAKTACQKHFEEFILSQIN